MYAAVAILVWWLRSPSAHERLLVAPMLAGLAIAAVVAVGVAGLEYHYQRKLAAAAYIPDDPTVELAARTSPPGTRIALAGTWDSNGLEPVAPLFGPRLQNHVAYLGPFVQHLREEYTSQPAFTRALKQGRYQWLVVGAGAPPVASPMMVAWARAAGYKIVARSKRLVLMAPA
jgi:hypothetical protein